MGWSHYSSDGTSTSVSLTSSVDLPIGTVMKYAGTAAPSGWALCDGSLFSRSTFSQLFAAIGTSYGVGDGSTTFNVPDLRGKVPVGKDAATFATLGATGGVETVALTAAQGGASNHTHTDNIAFGNPTQGTHQHSVTTAYSEDTGQTLDWAFANGAGRSFTVHGGLATNSLSAGAITQGAKTGAVTSSGATAGTAHTNLQPYLVMNFIIKVQNTNATLASDFTSGQEVGFAQVTANSVGSGDKVTVTVVGDGVTSYILEAFAAAISTTGAAGTNLFMSIYDGAVATGTNYVGQYFHTANVGYQAGINIRGKIAPFSGSKTFYLHLNNSAGTPNLQAAATYPAFLRVTKA